MTKLSPTAASEAPATAGAVKDWQIAAFQFKLFWTGVVTFGLVVGAVGAGLTGPLCRRPMMGALRRGKSQ